MIDTGPDLIDSNSVRMLSDENNYSFVDGFYDLSSVDHFWFKWRFRAFQQQLNDARISTESGWRVLDIGAGKGTLRDQLEGATNWKIDITDLDVNGLRKANNGRGETLFYDINQREPSFANRYDGVILFDVLEHVENTRPFIESVLYHVRPGGFLFINVPAIQVLFSRFDSVQGHYRRYNKLSLKAEFDDVSVSLVDLRYWGLLNVPLLCMRRVILDALQTGKSDTEVYRKGFEVPGKLIHNVLSKAMRIETSLISRPPLGSSLLVALQKNT